MKILFELSTSPLSPGDRAADYEFEKFFFEQNPWWVEEGLPVDVEEEGTSREDAIGELEAALPDGYRIEGERVIVTNPLLYWNVLLEKVKGLVSNHDAFKDSSFNPLCWWKNQIDGLDTDILIHVKQNEELMTLNEFLLYMMREEHSEFHIGSIFYLYE